MERKKIYTAICIGMGAVFAYSLFWMGRFVAAAGFARYDFSFWLNGLFTFLGIAGLIIFASSGFRKSALLRIFMCKIIAFLPVTAIYQYVFYTNPKMNLSDPFVYIGTAIVLIMTVSSAAGLWLLTRERLPKLTQYTIGNESFAEFAPASAWARLGNYVVDVLFVFYMVYSFFEVAKYKMLLNRSYNDLLYYRKENDFPPELLPLVCILLYFFILEGIFNTTAGKCATNTIIVNPSGELPSVGQRLGRTLCRLIPFEAFSFIGSRSRGWHDSVTDTYVIKSVNEQDAKEAEDELAGFLADQK